MAGTYAVAETVANRTMNVYADDWLGVMDGHRGPTDAPPVTASAQAAKCGLSATTA